MSGAADLYIVCGYFEPGYFEGDDYCLTIADGMPNFTIAGASTRFTVAGQATRFTVPGMSSRTTVTGIADRQEA